MKLTPTPADLIQLAQILSIQNDYQQVVRLTSEQVACLFAAETATILMVNPRTMESFKTIHHESSITTPKEIHLLHTLVSGWIMKNNHSLHVPDLAADPRFNKIKSNHLAVKSMMGVPLRTEGTLIGALLIFNKLDGSTFDQDDLVVLEKMAVIVAPYLRNAEALQSYFQSPLPESALLGKYAKFGLLGKSKKFVALLNAIEAAARCDVRVLLEGQSGVGKERVANAIHRISARSEGPFIAVDCGAIPANLMESELFGHVRGAFTGATQDRKGLMEAANKGTLFMDEVSSLPVDMQGKLMRALQEGEVKPVGANFARKVDVRIISASPTPLQSLVAKGEFREDLFYRLYVYPISLPSLNDRREDIPMLADHFLHRAAVEQNKNIQAFHEGVLAFMKQRNWAGNIRELENFVERLVTLTPADRTLIDYKLLPEPLQHEYKKVNAAEDDIPITRSLAESMDEFEEQLIRKALNSCGWNQSKAAEILKVSEQTMRYKMHRLGIRR